MAPVLRVRVSRIRVLKTCLSVLKTCLSVLVRLFMNIPDGVPTKTPTLQQLYIIGKHSSFSTPANSGTSCYGSNSSPSPRDHQHAPHPRHPLHPCPKASRELRTARYSLARPTLHFHRLQTPTQTLMEHHRRSLAHLLATKSSNPRHVVRYVAMEYTTNARSTKERPGERLQLPRLKLQNKTCGRSAVGTATLRHSSEPGLCRLRGSIVLSPARTGSPALATYCFFPLFLPLSCCILALLRFG